MHFPSSESKASADIVKTFVGEASHPLHRIADEPGSTEFGINATGGDHGRRQDL